MSDCVHHIVYETPNGTFSAGVCRKCGFETLGRNSEDEYTDWTDPKFAARMVRAMAAGRARARQEANQ